MKKRGLVDVESALNRARKLRAMGRISGPSLRFIEEHLLEVQAEIVRMEELDQTGTPIED